MMSGAWVSEGYGWRLDFDTVGYRRAHVTRQDCILGERGSYEEFSKAFERIDKPSPMRMVLRNSGDLTDYVFHAESQPLRRPWFKPGDNQDAEPNYDSLAQQFAEHYAFFELHGVDWTERRRRYRTRVRNGMHEGELFDLLSELLKPLRDGHVVLSGAGRVHQYLRETELRAAMQAAFGTPDRRITLRSTIDAVAPAIGETLLAPFATRSPLRQAGNGLISWCKLEPGIGYLNVLRLFGFAETYVARTADDLPRAATDVAELLKDDLAALDRVLDAVFDDLGDCCGLVLDLRINGGGFDRAGLAVAGRFTERARPAFTKCAVAGNGRTDGQTIEVTASRRPFGGPVVVLTSPLCLSAGEVLALCMRSLPTATLVGQPTAGMLSDNLIKPMPNGWELSLSNEVYTSSDGHQYEGCGVEPDVPLAVTRPDAFVKQMRDSLVRAVELLSQPGQIPARHRTSGAVEA